MGVDPGPLPFPTSRLDPLNGFSPYNGKINLISSHYFASLAFEALFGFVIAAAVVIGTIVWLIVLAFKECCCRKPVDPMQEVANEHVKIEIKKKKFWPKLFLVIFCAAAIAGGACVWTGGFRLRKTADTFLDKSVATVDTLINQVLNVTAALNTASKSISVDTNQIEDAQDVINNAKKQLKRIVDLVKDGVARFNVGTTAYGAGVIGISIFAVVFSMLHVKHAIGFTNFFVWWLTVIGWILTGLTFIIYVFSRDLCSAKENIDRTGGVRQLLPCISPSAGQKALNVTYAGIYQAVEDANLAMFRALNASSPATAQRQKYMCNPVSVNGTSYSRSRACGYNSTLPGAGVTVFRGANIWEFNQTYQSLRCQYTLPQQCYQTNQIPYDIYDSQAQLASFANVFIVVAPLAEDLLLCDFVVRAYDDLGGYLCANIGDNTTTFFGGFFLYSLAFFPIFVILVIGYNRFRPACCDSGRGQVDSDLRGSGEQGQFVVGVVPQDDMEKGGNQQQLGQYAANHGY